MGKTNETRTAREAYGDNARDVEAILEMLKGSLAEARARAAERPLHWGHVGSIAHVRELLLEPLAFISGGDLDEIDEQIKACRRPHEPSGDGCGRTNEKGPDRR